MTPPDCPDANEFLEQQRRVLLDKCSGIFAFIGLAVVCAYQISGMALSPLVLFLAFFVSGLLFLVPFVSPQIKSSQSMGIFLSVIVGCGAFADAWKTGGVSSGGAMLLVQVPLLATFFSGIRTGFYAFLCVTFGFVALSVQTVLVSGLETVVAINALRAGMLGVVSAACAFLLVSAFLHIIQRACNTLLIEKTAAEISRDATSSFISDLAHELRSPLNSIIGFSTMLADKSASSQSVDRVFEYGSAIRASGEHLLKLINEILHLSKLQTETIELDKELVDPSDLARACASIMQPLAEARALQIHVDCEDGHGLVIEANETRIRQVIFNLLSNAIKFSDEGSDIDFRLTVPEEGKVAFCISDHGPGMSAEEIDICLLRFGQARSSAVKGTKVGVGLGLPISANIARMHDGELTIESTPGEGTSVSLILKCATFEDMSVAA